MDNKRLVLLAVFSFSLLMLWEAWQKQHAPPPVPSTASSQSVTQSSGAVPTASTTLNSASATAGAPPTGINAPAVASTKVQVKTDLFVADISSMGGDLIGLSLVNHKATDDKTKNFVLLEDSTEHFYQAQTGLLGDGLPNHKAEFTLAPGPYELQPGSDTLQVRLEAPETNGLKVSKIYTFHRGNYLIDVGYEITNKQQTPLMGEAYYQLARDGKIPPVGLTTVSTFTGPAVYTDEAKFQKISFTDIEKGKAKFANKANNGWLAIVQHYFVAGWVPKADDKTERTFYADKTGDNLFRAGMKLPFTVAPGQTATIGVPFYAGPQEQARLEKVAAGFDLVVDYGWLTLVAVPLYWVLDMFHSLVGNWGWAVILLTVSIKLLFFPLSAASYKSMAKMKLVAPKLAKLKEQYGSDRARMNQEMMELYKKEKINPLGGCLPIVVQIPVFIALYWVLLGSVEMRHAPWLLWITDLSSKDPYYILPLIMGATMFIQTKLNPAPPDPIQAKVMLFMPIIFTGMFLFFPSGLVLYWVVNNTLSIAQQWQITKMMGDGQKPKAIG